MGDFNSSDWDDIPTVVTTPRKKLCLLCKRAGHLESQCLEILSNTLKTAR